ncbi:MAG: helix-turn-helix transcriptional regulator [Anaerolineales bacterium]|nr:helix-turn-helix transcriptional regulator [Anaerolineales bacterium]
MPSINPEILVWARKTAGLTEEEATERLGIQDARGILAVDRLRELENGETELSRPMLLKMTKVYRRSLLLFYMSSPPEKVIVVRIFGLCLQIILHLTMRWLMHLLEACLCAKVFCCCHGR